MKKYLIFLLLWGSTAALAQPFNPEVANTYPTKSNPYYWKNRPPHPGYWQQDVHYIIKAYIDETKDQIQGSLRLTYTNNSPDALDHLFFHLYQEAFQPDSYFDKLSKANRTQPRYGRYEKDGLGTKVNTISAQGKELRTEQDNTILKVFLDQPLESGASLSIDITFDTYFGSGGVRRRMKKFRTAGTTHYDGVHWYPRMAVYDRKFGWCTDQHLGKEFYGNFGCYDVELNFASNYVVEATGTLLNRNEVLPAELRQKLDIGNFTRPIPEDSISIITPYVKGERKTWKYHAINVHDFAFTADPSYRIGEVTWNGIQCVSVAQEHHAHRWQNAAQYTADVIRVFSEDFGMYCYPKMVVADARDGMEYPMLTLDGGFDPDYRGLLAHEIGHNWFFGQVGSNETYRASLDEGFTQFLTAWALERIDGDTLIKSKPRSWYEARFKKPEIVRETTVYGPYLRDAIQGKDPVLETHSDDFGSALGHGGGYRHVYYKTGTMLYNLEYVLGEELFQKAMQHYFEQWKMAHPYTEDFRNSIIQYTKVDLNWFFDQWLTTQKTIDYAVKSVRRGKEENQYKIRFKRKGEMQMPLDFAVLGENDSLYHFHIPNNWFVKKTEATVLPRWIGWGKLNPKYEAIVNVPVPVKEVIIDPSQRLADIDRLNNRSTPPVSYQFDSRIFNQPDFKNYEVLVRPELWYNGYDGFKAGFHVEGGYLNYKHIFELTAWLNTGVAQRIPDYVAQYDGVNNEFNPVSLRFSYKTGLNKLWGKSNFFVSGQSLDGLKGGRIGLEKWSHKEDLRVYGYFKTMYRKDSADLYYLLYPREWIEDRFNNTLNVGLDKQYSGRKTEGLLNIHLRSSSLGSDYSFAQLSLTHINRWTIGRTRLSTRIFAQYGTGSSLPRESALFLAGANPEEMMDSKYNRAIGFYDYAWTGDYGASLNHFQAGGGLNIRAYAGYLAPEEDANGNITYHYAGNTGASISAELDLRDLVRWKPRNLSRYFRWDFYLFGDAGVMNKNINGKAFDFATLRADAGLGTALTIKKFGPLQKVKPLTLRFDMPFFVNAIPANETNYFAFRWLVGVSRSF